MKRLALALVIAVPLLPVLGFEALYRYGLRGVDLTLPPAEDTPALLQDALWIASGETPDSGAQWMWLGNYRPRNVPPGAHAANWISRRFIPEHRGMLDFHLRHGAITVWFTRHVTESAMKRQMAAHNYFGRNVFGASAAAEAHFQKSIWALSPAEIATLAAISANPVSQATRLKRHRDWILMKLRDTGRITDEQLKVALAEP